MSVKCAVVTTRQPDVVPALAGLCEQLRRQLGGTPDLVLAFYTPHHSGEIDVLRRRLLELLAPRVLLGCPGAGIIGGAEEVEGEAGLALWGGRWPGSALRSFELAAEEEEGEPKLTGWPATVAPGTGFLVLADPHSTPADTLLEGFAERYPGAPVIGGIASGSPGPGDALLLTADGVRDQGCVGVAIGGSVRIDPVVSQGCRPVGKHFVITQAQRNVILKLGGKPALAQLRSVFTDVGARDRELMQHALHIGRVVDERKSAFDRRDLLVRNVLGIDPRAEALAINDFVRPGQTVQFMVRDSAAAEEDLAALLAEEARRGPALGALLFSCNGRGRSVFGTPNHDIDGVHKGIGDVATAGFFANGEIGPVGGHPFVHGFTASIALFRESGAAQG
jgi:small ligand-binding sensory domain FIST